MDFFSGLRLQALFLLLPRQEHYHIKFCLTSVIALKNKINQVLSVYLNAILQTFYLYHRKTPVHIHNEEHTIGVFQPPSSVSPFRMEDRYQRHIIRVEVFMKRLNHVLTCEYQMNIILLNNPQMRGNQTMIRGNNMQHYKKSHSKLIKSIDSKSYLFID